MVSSSGSGPVYLLLKWNYLCFALVWLLGESSNPFSLTDVHGHGWQRTFGRDKNHKKQLSLAIVLGSAVSLAPQFTGNKAVQEKDDIINDWAQPSHVKAQICKVGIK